MSQGWEFKRLRAYHDLDVPHFALKIPTDTCLHGLVLQIRAATAPSNGGAHVRRKHIVRLSTETCYITYYVDVS